MQHYLDKLQPTPDAKVFLLEVTDARGDSCGTVQVTRRNLLEVIVEISTIYELAPLTQQDFERMIPAGDNPSDWSLHDPKMGLQFDVIHDAHGPGSREYAAYCLDGDTHAQLSGYGPTVIEAIADLARNQGFESEIATDGGKPKLKAFFRAIEYGRERLSDEILKAELEAEIAPETGSW